MRSPADPARLATLLEHRAHRLRRDASAQAEQAAQRDREAQTLRSAADKRLQAAQLGEEHGLDRQRLFERLRGVAIARAHVLECELRAGHLQEQAGDAREQEQQLRHAAAGNHSRARRLQAVGAHIDQKHRQARLRRQERQIQEEYTCR
ncbi:hypothetical protein B8X02_09030 [Stenotrophomonas rhizophila]|jgi:hypothetical protein|uniref:Uncharacterized protein n=1 Tax=Stenotrophomonas rhizophila TaxID=216778 RepID=A0AAP5AGQ5_9GAMM|nr:hypothetical protein [Stenotrophomonas rhizophila]MDQ1107921.1 hypothetical protein [Stenotrophomonas rhizophila]PAK92234.1 hypothetical protein B8X02_09030 [Stenotrophomonas rhizophila]UQY86615.1 hypothetical protein LQE85_14120 [Stenotrophomonas rhizophila]